MSFLTESISVRYPWTHLTLYTTIVARVCFSQVFVFLKKASLWRQVPGTTEHSFHDNDLVQSACFSWVSLPWLWGWNAVTHQLLTQMGIFKLGFLTALQWCWAVLSCLAGTSWQEVSSHAVYWSIPAVDVYAAVVSNSSMSNGSSLLTSKFNQKHTWGTKSSQSCWLRS